MSDSTKRKGERELVVGESDGGGSEGEEQLVNSVREGREGR